MINRYTQAFNHFKWKIKSPSHIEFQCKILRRIGDKIIKSMNI